VRSYRVTSYATGESTGTIITSKRVKAYSYDEALRRSGVKGAVVGVRALY
jgi:hypothetical protein